MRSPTRVDQTCATQNTTIVESSATALPPASAPSWRKAPVSAVATIDPYTAAA